MTTTDQPGQQPLEEPLDEQRLMSFVFRAVDEVGATLNAALVVLGDKLGWYEALAERGPMTAEALADAAGTALPYTRDGSTRRPPAVRRLRPDDRSPTPSRRSTPWPSLTPTAPAYLPAGLSQISPRHRRPTASTSSTSYVTGVIHQTDLFNTMLGRTPSTLPTAPTVTVTATPTSPHHPGADHRPAHKPTIWLAAPKKVAATRRPGSPSPSAMPPR